MNHENDYQIIKNYLSDFIGVENTQETRRTILNGLQSLKFSRPVNFICDERNNSPMTIEDGTVITFQFENDNVNTVSIFKGLNEQT